MNWLKPLKLINYFRIGIIISAVILIGCGEKKRNQEAIASVNDSYLYESDINVFADSANSPAFNKDEYIRNWINTELLYQDAVKNGITDEASFKSLIEKSRKELAKSIWLNRFLDEKVIVPSQKELEEYYHEFIDIFKVLIDTYYFNSAVFNNEDKAIQFRTALMESDWNKSTKTILKDTSVVEINTDYLLSIYKIISGNLSRVIKEMIPGEISLVIPLENGSYAVVQLIDRFEKNQIPPFKAIIELVKQSAIEKKKKDFLDEYLNKLYSENEIEIKK